MQPRRRRLLLAARALSCGALVLACKNPEPLPGNPKGSWYDEGGAGGHGGGPAIATDPAGNSGGAAPDAGTPEPPPPPANPKGSWYDDGGYESEKDPKEKA